MKIPIQTLDALDNSDNNLHLLKAWIKQQALDLGFSDCGVVHPDNPIFPEQLEKLQQWLADGHHGKMKFFMKIRINVPILPYWLQARKVF